MARTFDSYAKHLRLYGPYGVLKAAEKDLSPEDYERLAKLVKAAEKASKGRK